MEKTVGKSEAHSRNGDQSYLVEALLDGELSPTDRKVAQQILQDDPVQRQRFETLARQREALRRWAKSRPRT